MELLPFTKAQIMSLFGVAVVKVTVPPGSSPATVNGPAPKLEEAKAAEDTLLSAFATRVGLRGVPSWQVASERRLNTIEVGVTFPDLARYGISFPPGPRATILSYRATSTSPHSL